MVPLEEFEAARPQLTAIAFRLLGSVDDAEDAVQSTWIRARAVDADTLRNTAAWLTTVLTRVCLDQLRARQRRREEPLFADLIPDEALAADEQYLRRENISRALMVILARLTPSQRVAYVLHDLFDVPFLEVAGHLGTSRDSAKKHASRARERIAHRAPTSASPPATSVDSAVVDAFLAAAAGGDIGRVLALLADDCVRVVDETLVPPGTPTVVSGASAVAEETGRFADRIRASAPMRLAGERVHVVAPGGHPLAVVAVTTWDGRVARIDIARASTHPAWARWSATT
ncbi:sigma-70 family RNA polymerase sigma factor [Streptomyces sp. 3MP-14]|uniref:Sigma-70 family RNA polymerase sigma factor n=1 Tax=Streptomyces mimosae TaxID=2586635 RepID=A0A5N6A3I2_9ACTN|nr:MULTISPECIES: sigma-70 family RNA polymerase sigma factor [Streptomyces]KAB8162563.1 sigma-70 family RNA polymerase sigma factor [Streptomyces mimosae]KAB8174390.1 sigma-70 family RNA polymerase sigma factor [Streptomyces sp. 3MP-14]